MQKGSAQFLIIFITLSVLIGSGIYFFQSNRKNNPPKTTQYNTYNNYDNYKTYSHKTLGFQLEYDSKGLIAKEDSEKEFNQRGGGDFRKNFKGYVEYEPGKFLGAVVVLGNDQNFDTNPFTVWVFDNPNDLSIDEWYKSYWYYPFVWGDFTYKGKVELAPKDEATVSGQVGKSGMIDYQPGKPKFVYLSQHKKIYLFRIIGETGNKILESFKFLKQETADCKVTGCSGQVCSDQDVITTCEWIEAYACYKNAKCERQADGECSWTKTEQLTECLQEKGESK